ncbi:type I-E CRISPR-associated protein Cas6/Cse3/CasE [Nocardia sp. NPDC051832]|uniref:type I-E CRISPR-associated protein Cas6/Cse3/CasE n=1 Tax=Nocardia sp. NPDC051832 TaxID=3155673 RepID=UPI00341DB857
MYLSRVPLNPARAGTRKFLSSPHVTHGAVMKSFPPGTLDNALGDGRLLWRIDKNSNDVHLYVVSPAAPDFTHIIEQAGWPTTGAWETRKYGQLLDKLTPGQLWHFRLTANPVRNVKNRSDPETARARGKVTALEADQELDWLHRKTISAGFGLTKAGPATQREDDVRIISRENRTFMRSGRKVTLSTATFEGVLEVTDADLLRTTLIQGIGRAKGYGCGLLTLAPNQ